MTEPQNQRCESCGTLLDGLVFPHWCPVKYARQLLGWECAPDA